MKIRPRLRLLVALLLLAASAGGAGAQERPYTPARGSAERQAVMDAFREVFRREMGKQAIFEVAFLRVQRGWAFAEVVPKRPGGAEFDWRGTRYEEGWREGMMDPSSFALLRRRDRRWSVVRFAIGPTDVAWDGWDRETGAPRGIFPYP